MSAATCTETGNTGDQYCTVCEQIITAGAEIPALGHDWGAWSQTGNTHTHTCQREGCGETQSKPHSWAITQTIQAATCTAQGSAVYTCLLCDMSKTDKTAIDSTNHADYGTHTEGRIEATCAEDGFTGITYCDGCSNVISNGEPIAKETAAHTLTHVEAKAATVDTEGIVEHYHCELCGKNFADADAT